MCGPVEEQIPSITIFGRTWFSLTLDSFDHVNFTAVTDEYRFWYPYLFLGDCLPTTAFAVSSIEEFVVWTFSSPST
jgi:hypothetical protein